jgi:hypothetical protein
VKSFLYILFFCTVFGNYSGFSQEDIKIIATDTIQPEINPLAPAKAAFYSALLPGLGQAYNKKYWKIPVVYAALGTSISIYAWNQKKYTEYRDAYKQRVILGDQSTDQFQGILDKSRLLTAQKGHQRNRDLSLLVTAAIYILNIVDANVSAHLQQFNVNGKLTVRPDIKSNEFDYKQSVGLTLNYNF